MDSYRASLALLDNATETHAIPGFAVKRTAFGKKVDDIVDLITEQAKITEGKVAERDRVFGEMITAVLAFAGVLRSHAAEHNLSDLLATVWVTPTDFNKARFADKVVMAQAILDAAKPRLAELAPFEVTAESLAAVQAKVGAARDVLPTPRGAIADRKAATEQLAVAFRAAQAFRELQLDPLLLPLKETAPQFYAKYLARCQVKRSAKRSKDEAGADEAEKGGEAVGSSGVATSTMVTDANKPAV